MKTLEEYNGWLSNIPDRIQELKQTVPALVAHHLDGSLASLDVLERHLLEHYSTEDMIAPERGELLHQLASYMGNVAERELPGCTWTIDLEDPRNVDHGFPILTFSDGRASFNPFTYLTTALDRKRGNFVSAAITKRKP